MTNEEAKIEALRYAIYVCQNRKTGSIKLPAYIAACEDIELFLEAAIERIEAGEDMTDYAYFQKS